MKKLDNSTLQKIRQLHIKIPQPKLHTVQISSICWLVLVAADPAVKIRWFTPLKHNTNFVLFRCVFSFRLSMRFLGVFLGNFFVPHKNRVPALYIKVLRWILDFKNCTKIILLPPIFSWLGSQKQGSCGELGELFSKMQKFPQPYVSRCYA